MKATLDTDVIVAAMRSPAGASAELLRKARRGEIIITASVGLFLEYEAVCSRPIQILESGLTVKDVSIFLDALAVIIEPVKIHFLWRPQLRDPADELVLEAAVNSRASTLVTFNLRHFVGVSKSFNLSVENPGDYLRSIK